MNTSDDMGEHTEAAMLALNELQLQFDARALAAACMSKAAFLYANLRQLGHQSQDATIDVFSWGLKHALSNDGPKARVQTRDGHVVDPSVKN